MNNLTTETKKYILKTFSKSKYYLSENQHNILLGLESNKIIKIDGNSINTSNIAEIMETEDYYMQYPDERPDNVNYTYPNGLPKEQRDENYKSKKYNHLTKKERITKALKTWKRQRDNKEVEVNSGGLQRLIDHFEKLCF